jgi:hypothetical protein
MKDFFISVMQATPKQRVKLVDSPFGGRYLRLDESLKDRPDLRLDVLKSLLREYQAKRRNLSYAVKELEILIDIAQKVNQSTDLMLNSIFSAACKDLRRATTLSIIYGCLRNELPSWSSR